jgi:Carbohydrate binding domain
MKVIAAIAWFACGSVAFAQAPRNLRCEWEVNPPVVHDPCPEFYWECASQGGFSIAVATAPDGFGRPLWETARQSRLPIIEYAGLPLRSGSTYYWKVRVSDKDGRPLGESPAQHFTFEVRPLPHVLPTVRTFVNFAGDPKWAKDKIDMCFRKEAKRSRADILATQYALVSTMVVPSGKADDLQRFCQQHGLDFEDCFSHFAQDTAVTLHVGAELAANPREKRLCPGWDPRNDRNGDGRVDDAEFRSLANPKATARERRAARIPIYFWGPPRDDYVMNVGNAGYQEFMAALHAPQMAEGFDGIYFDTVPPRIPTAGSNPVVEYPRDDGHWQRDLQMMLAKIKLAMPHAIITANGWQADPMVIEGFQSENWLNITSMRPRWQHEIEAARACDRRGKWQMLQYNPIYDEKLAEFGPKVGNVSRERDQLYGLATYLMAHGDCTFFGFGSHPYAHVTDLWFKAIAADLGQPAGEFRLFSEAERSTVTHAANLLKNGGFETNDGWQWEKPVERDGTITHSGHFSARIASDSTRINNINRQPVFLKPHTAYTLTAWIKTDNVAGSPGAQVYPYDFRGMTGAGLQITVTGTTGWTRYRQVFKTGDEAAGRINFRVFGATGTAWFDDIELVEGAIYTDAVFARDFTKGLVLIKPYAGGSYGDETASLVKLPCPLRPLNTDGSLGAALAVVSLRNGEAVILLRP